MNKHILSLSAALLGSMGLMAQSKQLSLGVDLGLPQGDFNKEFSMAVGPTAGFELPIGDHIGITAQASYCVMMLKDDIKEVLDGATLIPLQAGLKYYFSESQKGLYAHAQLGVHMFTEKFKENAAFAVAEDSESSTLFSWGIGVGYQLEKFDLGLRYNSISPKEEDDGGESNPFNYIGLRVAYLINL